MKAPPIVTILGRQNVGKSTLYNRIAGKAANSITDNIPGVTRDVLEVIVERDKVEGRFILRDTPGLDMEDANELSENVLEIAQNHLRESHLIIHVIDKKDIREYDYKLIEILRKDRTLSEIPVIHAINKVDSQKDEVDLEELYRMGIVEPIPISALSGKNLGLLLEKVNSLLPRKGRNIGLVPDVRVAIVGKPNSGKSSLLNAILGYKRAVVSEVAGTTRDSLNSYFRYKEKLISITDTAGIRRKSKFAQRLEFYSYKRALKAIDASEIVILLLDATKGVGEYDKRIFSYLEKLGKPLVIAFNKWDLIPDKTDKTYREFIEKVCDRLPALRNQSLITLSALTKQRVNSLLDRIIFIHNRLNLKIPTGELNRKLREWMNQGGFSTGLKRTPKVKYATQISTNPVRFVLFVNSIELFTPNILSYLKKKFDSEYNLEGIPVQIDIRDEKTG